MNDSYSTIGEALMEAAEVTQQMGFEDMPFVDMSDEVVEEPAPPTVRYADRFNFQDEPVTIFDFVTGIVV